MNKKSARTLVLLAVLALFAVTFATVRPAYTSDFAVTVGECGYYQNVGTLHRNGLVTPDHCTTPADSITVTVYEQYIPVMVESPAIDPVDTESKQVEEQESEDKPVVSVPEEKKDKPVVESPEKEKKDKKNNGNHYGNDKPDNNPKDEKNKHDGEQTADDHHGHNGNSH